MSQQTEDVGFAADYNAALYERPSRSATLFVLTILFVFSSFIVWANWAQVDEVTRGEGRVVPSGKNQVVQSLEGGIVKEILVKSGSVVRKGDLLLRIDDTGFSSSLGEVQAKRAALRAQLVRLQHEVNSDRQTPLDFPEDLEQQAPATVASERHLYLARQSSLDVQLSILGERVKQRERELSEVKYNIVRLQENLVLAKEEEELKAPLVVKGVIPKTDYLRLRREISDLGGQLAVAKESLLRLEAAIREAQAMVNEQELKFREDARAELSQKVGELSIIGETMRGASDRVVRTDVHSPVDGIVNELNINTVGGVVKPGEPLMEIVPQEDSLLVEAKVRPNDIAFVRPGQKANVKITAYDFSIYGGLDGEVVRISADSAYDEQAREVYYLVTVKTLTNRLGKAEQNLMIIPGMVARVDILTGKKSILQYLLKPINKARFEALRER
jgi:adhesin transport system membrane fusion protein